MNFLKSAPGEEPIEVEGLLAAAPDAVFRAWTTPDEIKQWFGIKPNGVTSVTIDLQVGGIWRFEIRNDGTQQHFLEGDYCEIASPTKLVFTWSHVIVHPSGARDASPVSLVTVEFAAEGAATRVRLRHEAIAKRDGRLGVGAGWEASFQRLTQSFAATGGQP